MKPFIRKDKGKNHKIRKDMSSCQLLFSEGLCVFHNRYDLKGHSSAESLKEKSMGCGLRKGRVTDKVKLFIPWRVDVDLVISISHHPLYLSVCWSVFLIVQRI